MKTPKIWKVCVIGDKDVGKTSLIKRFVYDTFSDEKEESLESRAYKRKMDNITLMVWDVSVYEEHIDRILNGARVILIVGDITRGETYGTMREIAKFVNGHPGMKIFVGNKSDLKYKAEFWKDELDELSGSNNAPYFVVSAKTGEYVEDMFKFIVKNA